MKKQAYPTFVVNATIVLVAAFIAAWQPPLALAQDETPITPTLPPDPCDTSLSVMERLGAIATAVGNLNSCLESVLSGTGTTLDQPVVDALSAVRAGCQTMITRIDLFLEGSPPPGTSPGGSSTLPPDPCDTSLSILERLQATAARLTQLDLCLQGALQSTTNPASVEPALNTIATICQVMIARIDVFLSNTPRELGQTTPAHLVINPIVVAVDSLAAKGVLDKGHHNTLKKELTQAQAAARLAKAVVVIRRLEHFQRKTADFVVEQVLTQQQGQLLFALANSAVGQVRRSAFAPIRVSITPSGVICPDPPPCDFPVLYVAESNGGGVGLAPDGSAGRPYPTIQQALARAEALEACGVEIRVANGCYPGDLFITRDTRLVGQFYTLIAGSIINNGPFHLTVQSVNLVSESDACPLPPGLSADGAIQVDHPCARTSLRDVRIFDARSYGIRQRSGSLDARNVDILDTRVALEGDVARQTGAAIFLTDEVNAVFIDLQIRGSQRYGLRQKGGTLLLSRGHILESQARAEISAAGTGIWLSDSVKAALLDAELLGNGSSGLIVEDAGTEVQAVGVHVRDTAANAYLWENFCQSIGAVEVFTGAELVMEWCDILRSEVVALRARHGTTRVCFVNGQISDTSALPGCIALTGINVIARDGSSIELSDFTSSDADLCGLQVLLHSDIHAQHGVVSHCAIGANIQDEDFDLARIQDDVAYIDDRVVLDGSSLPVPEPVAGFE